MQNDMRDRLVEIINKDNCPSPYMCSDKCKYSHLEQCIGDRLADRILADGWLRLPCKVGETVYCINTIFPNDPRINECEVDALHITSGKNKIGYKKPSYALVRDKNMKSLSARMYFENFGKTVFLTKDQAEQKLKELSENG